MREQDLVFLIYLPITLALFALFAARDLPPLAGRQISASLAQSVRTGTRSGAIVSKRTRVIRLIGWTAFTQVVPLLVALSNAAMPIRLASGTEMVAALGWVVLLLRSPRVTLSDAD